MRNRRCRFGVVTILSVALLSLAPCSVWGQPPDDRIVIGNRLSIESKVLKEERTLLVSTPSSYGVANESYPVLFLLDGDDHFHHTTGVVDFLAKNDRIPELIVVAVPNTDRTRDLTPPSTADKDIESMPTQGGADNFLRFLSDELIPFVDDKYRTRPYRILIGHSFGGLFAIHALTTRPEVFDGYIAISPSLQWSEQGLVAQAQKFFESTPELQADLYMTVGNEGGALLGGVRKVSGILDETTPRGFRWGFRLMEEESHGSVPHRSTYQGLEAIFRGWHLPSYLTEFDRGGLDAIDEFFAEGGRRFGYDRKTPGRGLFELAFQLIQKERLDDASQVLLREHSTPPPSVLLDMLADAHLERGDEEQAKRFYLKSLEQSPGKEVPRKRLIEMGVDVDDLLPDVEVSAEVLATYVGTYELSPDLKIEISLEGKSLFAKATGQPKLDLVALSTSRFSAAAADIHLAFETDSNGNVHKLIVIQAGLELPAKRID